MLVLTTSFLLGVVMGGVICLTIRLRREERLQNALADLRQRVLTQRADRTRLYLRVRQLEFLLDEGAHPPRHMHRSAMPPAQALGRGQETGSEPSSAKKRIRAA
jgi:hypothetical protein